MTYTVSSSDIKAAVVSGFMYLDESYWRAPELSDSIIVDADVEITVMEGNLCQSLLFDTIEERLVVLPKEAQNVVQQRVIVYSSLNILVYNAHVRDGMVMSSYLYEGLREMASLIGRNWQTYFDSALPDALLKILQAYRVRYGV